MKDATRFYPVSKWAKIGGLVKRPFTYDTAEAAEASGREAEARYGDQKFICVVSGKNITECEAEAAKI